MIYELWSKDGTKQYAQVTSFLALKAAARLMKNTPYPMREEFLVFSDCWTDINGDMKGMIIWI